MDEHPPYMTATDFIARVDEMDGRIDVVQECATHAYERSNRANDLSQFAINRIDSVRTIATSYQSAIDQLEDRVTELEHKIELLTGPCICESLL